MGKDYLSRDQLLLVGNKSALHVGAHFLNGARSLGLDATLCDSASASNGSWALRKWSWHARGHRPLRLEEFGRQVIHAARVQRPNVLVATGIAPLTAQVLDQLDKLHICLINYLTDDPWNPAHYAPWFLDALPHYSIVFTTRCSNLTDLSKLGCRQVEYLPFAFAPELHYPNSASIESNQKADVFFAGGADSDRVPYIKALNDAGLTVALYGDYWQRYPATRSLFRGYADPATVRCAVASSRISLCLVRRANRDGHVMRSFEIPAMGGCMLTEDTSEHRMLFGKEGDAVVYFNDIPEMVKKTRWLRDDPAECKRLALAAHQLIVGGKHTYKDRLQTMFEISGFRLGQPIGPGIGGQ